jgi:hypothetical protein
MAMLTDHDCQNRMRFNGKLLYNRNACNNRAKITRIIADLRMPAIKLDNSHR